MILGRPWALVLLAIPVLLLWLRLRAQRPRAAEASSLLVWQKVSTSETVPTRPRPPLAAWLEAAGAILLALGAADPCGAAVAAGGVVEVLVDTSASMAAKGLDAHLRLESARAASSIPEEAIRIRNTASPERDLSTYPSGVPVLVLTDHHVPGIEGLTGRLRAVGFGRRGFNAGIAAASGVLLPDGRWRLHASVEVHGSSGPVQGRFRIGEREEEITASPGASLTIDRDLMLPDWKPVDPLAMSIAFSGDALAEDDSVVLRHYGGRARFLVRKERPDLVPLRRALEAAGAVGAEAVFGPDDRGTLVMGPEGESGDGELVERLVLLLPESTGGEAIVGSNVIATTDPRVRDVRIDPDVTLGNRAASALEGAPLLVDRNGPLVTVLPGTGSCERIQFAFVPGGTWVERDPSFVVFARNLVDAAGGYPWVNVEGVLDPRETREAAEGETFGDLATALAEARQPDPATRTSLAVIVLAAGAALLASAWFAKR